MHRVLITGASGFVGSALSLEMVRKGYVVRCAVRQDKTVPGQLLATKHFIVIGDIGPNTNWSIALKDVDCVIHLAARVHVLKDNADNPLAAYRRINTEATEHLARSAALAGVRRLVFLSSVNVNGIRSNGEPFREYDPVKPSNPYGISKWEAELALARVARESGLEITILRAPLIYGAGTRGKFSVLIKAIMRGIPLPIASVMNRRSFLYIGNAVDALISASTHPAAAGKTFLLSDGQTVSTPELIRRIALELGVSARLLHCPPFLLRTIGRLLGKTDLVSGLIDSLQIDSSAIQCELGWAPPYTLEQGLRATAQWYRNHC